MRTLARTVAVPALLLALVACTPLASQTAGPPASVPTAPENADEAALRAAGEAWNRAYKALNTDSLVALYAPDALLMPETARTAKGQPAIRDFLKIYMALLADGGYQPFVANGVEIQVSGNLGVRLGTYSIGDQAGTVVDTGKWLETWRKTDGKWVITRDIWNSDNLPLFPPMAFTPGGAP